MCAADPVNVPEGGRVESVVTPLTHLSVGPFEPVDLFERIGALERLGVTRCVKCAPLPVEIGRAHV